jgi:hypothetical protein
MLNPPRRFEFRGVVGQIFALWQTLRIECAGPARSGEGRCPNAQFRHEGDSIVVVIHFANAEDTEADDAAGLGVRERKMQSRLAANRTTNHAV